MNVVRRLLNIIAVLLIAIAISTNLLVVNLKNFPLPFAFFGLLVVTPAIAHVGAALLSWNSLGSQRKPNAAVLGLFLSSISLFVSLIVFTGFVEARIEHFAVVGGSGWKFVKVVSGSALVIASAGLNIAYFRSVLVMRPNYSLKRTAEGRLR